MFVGLLIFISVKPDINVVPGDPVAAVSHVASVAPVAPSKPLEPAGPCAPVCISAKRKLEQTGVLDTKQMSGFGVNQDDDE